MNRDNKNAFKGTSLITKPVKKLRYTLLAVAIAQAVMVPYVQAATIFVTNEGDSDQGCTLREAVQSSNEGGVGNTGCVNSAGTFGAGLDFINFGAGVNTVTLTSSDLDISHSMRISGNGGTIQKIAALNDRLITIDGPYNVGLVDLTLSGGPVTGATRGAVVFVGIATLVMSNSVIKNGSGAGGGGLFLDNAAGTLLSSTVTDNSSNLNGGGIEISNNSTLTLFNSTISDNTVNNVGGGIAVDYSSTAIINTSTISGNSAADGAGINAQRASNLTLNQSLVTGNVGGGIRGNLNSNVEITNSTVSGNNSDLGGGVYARQSLITLTNSTVSNNTASIRGAGLYAFGSPSFGGPSFILRNTIVANSSGAEDCVVTFNSITANRQNIIEDGSCGTAAISTDPRLGPLADNGGRTLTHALLTNSPAISAGDNAVCAASPVNSVDQRGEPRANPDDTICDLGAFESPEGRAADTSTFFVIPTKNGKTAVIVL